MPADYLEVLGKAVPQAVADSGVSPGDVVGLAVDFTSCTVFPTDSSYAPLCEKPEFARRPHAYVKLWKHHASQQQGKVVNKVLAELAPETLARYGGEVSADWQLAKALALFEEDREVWDAASHFVEAGDWIIQRLTGELAASMSLAGYKGNFVDGSHPPAEVLEAMAPGFSRLLELLPQPEPVAMYSIYNIKTGDRLNRDMELHFIELPKYVKLPPKKIGESSKMERWLAYFANRLTDQEREELAMSEPAIRDAMEAERVFMCNPDEYLRYVNRQMAIMDYQSGLQTAAEEGEARGESRVTRLMSLLLERGLIDEARGAANSAEVRKKLFAKYHIE